MRRTAAMLAAMAAMLAMPATTIAQDPVGNAYGGDEKVLNEVSGGGESSVSPAGGGGGGGETPPPERRVSGGSPPVSTGSLPFTGLDLGLLAAGGLAMLGLGISLRRVSRSNS